jgi:hypothetical protein
MVKLYNHLKKKSFKLHVRVCGDVFFQLSILQQALRLLL